MPTTIDDARQLIQSRLADLDAEAKQLRGALASLGEGSARKRRPGRPRKSAPAAAAPPKRKRASRNRNSGKRAPRGQRREQLLAAIKSNPGARPAELAKSIGVKSTQVHALIAKARADKLIVKRGKGYALKG
jgi:hypothetical protein